MSSALTQFTEVLKGAGNFQQWASKMKNYLQSQKQWRLMHAMRPTEKYPLLEGEALQLAEAEVAKMKGKRTDQPDPRFNYDVTPENQSDIDEWEDNNEAALGNIRLRLADEISYKHKNEISAERLWRVLEREYGTPGISTVYAELISALTIQLPESADPSEAIDKLRGHFNRMAEGGMKIDDSLQTLILMFRMPQSM